MGKKFMWGSWHEEGFHHAVPLTPRLWSRSQALGAGGGALPAICPELLSATNHGQGTRNEIKLSPIRCHQNGCLHFSHSHGFPSAALKSEPTEKAMTRGVCVCVYSTS